MPKSAVYLRSMVFRLILTFFLILPFWGPGNCEPVNSEHDLNVPVIIQEQSNWCWAATTGAVFAYYGTNVRQCEIANYNWDVDYCCQTPTDPVCNDWTYLTPNVQLILNNWHVNSEVIPTAVSFNVLASQIDGDMPVYVRWGWKAGGGGHFVIAHGYAMPDSSNQFVHYMDPMSGYASVPYDYFSDNVAYEWTHTLINLSHQ